MLPLSSPRGAALHGETMPETRPPASKNLVTTDWLAARLGEPEVSIVDGSFYLPALKRNAREEFLAAHIPGAAFFDIDAIADHSTDLPHMLPGATQFAKRRVRSASAPTTRS